jgi:hypothetical protein
MTTLVLEKDPVRERQLAVGGRWIHYRIAGN